MIIGDFDTDARVLIVAEIGNNHEGSYAIAEEMVGRAAEAGVDAMKFQTFRTEHYISRRDDARFERLKSFELSHDRFTKLAAVARQEGVIFLSTPFDLESVRFLDALVPAFKIASGDNTFYPLLDAVARTGKPIMLSTGLADMTRLRQAKAVIETAHRGLLIASVVLASLVYAIDWTIAAVALQSSTAAGKVPSGTRR